MGGYTLGLDLGTTSIGWAVINSESGRIWAKDDCPGCGVRHFRESVNPKNNIPFTRDRATARGGRRTRGRRVQRKRAVRTILEGAGILPTSQEGLCALRQELSDGKGVPKQLRLYELRAHGLADKISLSAFAAILLQLAARRGFKSNRKSGEIIVIAAAPQDSGSAASPERATKKKSGASKENEPKKGSVTASINSLVGSMREHGSPTVGVHLYRIGKGEIGLVQDSPGREFDGQRVRGRHLLRSLVEDEFNRLWDSQRAFHEVLQDTGLRQSVHDAIFFQRPLKPSDHLIGRCECLPKLPRCPRADWFAMKWRVLKDVNHLRIWNDDGTVQELSAQQRTDIFKEMNRRQRVPFAELRALIKPPLLEKQMFNLEAGVGERGKRKAKKTEDATKPATRREFLPGNPVEAALIGAFGPRWDELDEANRLSIREAFCAIDDPEELLLKARDWGLDAGSARRLARQSLPEGYMAYSREAIKRMLAEFEKAIVEDHGITEYEARERCGLNRTVLRTGLPLLPAPVKPDGKPVTNNPVVKKALFELRKVVNAIIRLYGPPGRIVVEFARRMRLPLWKRAEIAAQNEANRKDKDAIKELLSKDFEIDDPSGSDVLAFRLWKQQGFMSPYSKDPRSQSPYTGRPISQADLQEFLNGEGNLHIDHILPLSRTLDDSMNNKCLCFRDENDAKGNDTPLEWLKEGSDEFNAMLQRVASMKQFGMPFAKRRRFSQKEVTIDKCLERQLKDTQYLARLVRPYLQSLFSGDQVARDQAVFCISGQATSQLRWHWGLNSILADNVADEKERRDLRHHAIDAVVVAYTNDKTLGRFADFFQRKRAKDKRFDPPEPWTEAAAFFDHVRRQVLAIIVSHRIRARIRGELHQDTHYAKTTVEGRFSYRKALRDLNVNEVHRICDDQIRAQALARLQGSGINVFSTKGRTDDENDASQGSKIPTLVWKEPLIPLKKDGTPRANAAPVKRVRIWIKDSSIQPIRDALPIQNLTTALIPFIKDAAHRELIHARLRERGISADPTDELLPAATFSPPLKGSDGRRIRRVDLEPPDGVRIPAQRRVLIKPGNLHHVEIYEIVGPRGKKKYHVEAVSRIEAADRLHCRLPIVARKLSNLPNARFLMSLCEGEMVELEDKGTVALCRFVTAPSKSRELRFRRHERAAIDDRLITKKPGSVGAIRQKVSVDHIGQVRRGLGTSFDPLTADARILEIAQRRAQGLSIAKAKKQLRDLGLAHCGAQLTAAIRYFREQAAVPSV